MNVHDTLVTLLVAPQIQ